MGNSLALGPRRKEVADSAGKDLYFRPGVHVVCPKQAALFSKAAR